VTAAVSTDPPELRVVDAAVGTRSAAVETIRAGDRLVLPAGRRVTVEAVVERDGLYTVRWFRPAERGDPGFRDPDRPRGDHNDGRYLGSLIYVPAGATWEIET
jgi:hypothetical protein